MGEFTTKFYTIPVHASNRMPLPIGRNQTAAYNTSFYSSELHPNVIFRTREIRATKEADTYIYADREYYRLSTDYKLNIIPHQLVIYDLKLPDSFGHKPEQQAQRNPYLKTAGWLVPEVDLQNFADCYEQCLQGNFGHSSHQEIAALVHAADDAISKVLKYSYDRVNAGETLLWDLHLNQFGYDCNTEELILLDIDSLITNPKEDKFHSVFNQHSLGAIREDLNRICKLRKTIGINEMLSSEVLYGQIVKEVYDIRTDYDHKTGTPESRLSTTRSLKLQLPK